MTPDNRSRFSELWTQRSTLVAASWGNAVAVSTMLFYSFGVFVIPLQTEFGWTRGQVTSTFFCAPIAYFLAGPATGWIADRYGARRVALTSIALFAAAFTLMATFTGGNIWKFYLFFLIVFIAGMGTTPIIYTRIINAAFDAKRGLALGIAFASIGVAALALPQLISFVIGDGNWRAGYVTLGILAASAWPLAFFLIKPQARAARGGATQAQPRSDITIKAALRSRIFWTMVAAFVLPTITAAGLIVHMVPLLRDGGLSAASAANIASLIGIGTILGRAGTGWLIDRLFAPYVTAVIFVITAAGFFALLHFGIAAAPVAAFLVGFAMGSEVDVLAYLTSRYFGLANYGVLYAILYSVASSSTTLAPVLVGWLYDAQGNYTMTLAITIGLLLISAVIVATLPAFRPEAESRDEHLGAKATVA